MSILTCPKCQGAMRETLKQSISIDVCTSCRGVWLDRGELERLALLLAEPAREEEASFLARGRSEPPRREYDRRRDRDDDDDDDDRHRQGWRGRQRSGMQRLMDFFD